VETRSPERSFDRSWRCSAAGGAYVLLDVLPPNACNAWQPTGDEILLTTADGMKAVSYMGRTGFPHQGEGPLIRTGTV
jgi:hypothetical protein